MLIFGRPSYSPVNIPNTFSAIYFRLPFPSSSSLRIRSNRNQSAERKRVRITSASCQEEFAFCVLEVAIVLSSFWRALNSRLSASCFLPCCSSAVASSTICLTSASSGLYLISGRRSSISWLISVNSGVIAGLLEGEGDGDGSIVGAGGDQPELPPTYVPPPPPVGGGVGIWGVGVGIAGLESVSNS